MPVHPATDGGEGLVEDPVDELEDRGADGLLEAEVVRPLGARGRAPARAAEGVRVAQMPGWQAKE